MGIVNQLKNPRVRRILGALLVLLVFLGIWRACVTREKQHHTYQVARSSNLAPLKFEGKEPNVLAFEGDVFSYVAHEEEMLIRLTTLNETNLFPFLDKGTYDGILVPIDPTPIMHERYYISSAIFYGGPVLIVRENSNVSSLKELQGRGIAIEAGSPLIFKLSQDNLLLVSYQNMIAALEDLNRGVIDGVILEANLAYTYTSGFYKDRLKVATAPLTDLGLRLVTDNTAHGKYLVEKFDAAFKKLVETGEYGKLIDKWDLVEP